MRVSLINIIIFLVFIACNFNSLDENIDSFKLTYTYEINLDRYTSPVEEYFQYVPDWNGEEVIAFHVRKKNVIKLYDLNTGKLLEELNYNDIGPDTLPNMYDFYILNKDTIFFNRRYHYELFQLDNSLKVVNQFKFLKEDEKIDPVSLIPLSGETFLIMFNHNKIFRVIGDKIFVRGVPDKNPDLLSFYQVDCNLVSVDLKTNEFVRLLGYPDKMKQDVWGGFAGELFSDYSYKKDQFCLSYAGDELVHLINKEGEFLSNFPAYPKNFKTITPILAPASESEKAYLAHYFEQFIFGSVLHDDYRDMIYRIALEPIPGNDDILLMDPLYRPRNMVVMAFDSKQDYRKVGEMRLLQSEKGVFLDRCFVNEKGLNITYVDLENEDKLYFKTFVVE